MYSYELPRIRTRLLPDYDGSCVVLGRLWPTAPGDHFYSPASPLTVPLPTSIYDLREAQRNQHGASRNGYL